MEGKLEEDSLQEEGDGPSIHSAYASFVGEAAKILELASQMGSNSNADTMLCTILDKYQEQCQLLDPHLESIVTSLFLPIKALNQLDDSGKSHTDRNIVMHRTCRVIYTLCKVRGFKTVTRFFPHEVTDLEPCLNLLSNENPANLELWYTRYVLLLWLSILVMVPFGLETVDSKDNGSAGVGLVDRILSLCNFCLGESAKTRDAAAYLLAIMLTRPDLESSYLVGFLQWCREQLGSRPSSFLSAGIYSALANIFKHGQRRSMLDKVPILLDVLQEQDQIDSRKDHVRTALQRKLVCKLAQRLGLTYVPVRVASWRYQRGCRSLLENLKVNQTNSRIDAATTKKLPDKIESDQVSNQPACEKVQHEDDDSYVPAEIDYIFDHMLRALSDRDTIVRWSGAKGIGRLTGRLPCHLADEIVEAVLQQFETAEGDQVRIVHHRKYVANFSRNPNEVIVS
jgi:tubulin-specific chaperone D